MISELTYFMGRNCYGPKLSWAEIDMGRFCCGPKWPGTLSIILPRGRTTKALIRLRGCVGWSAPLIFECNYVRFSLDTAHKYGNCHCNNCIVFQSFHTLARSIYGWHAQRALLTIASIKWKSEVSTKKKEPKREKRDTAESIPVKKSGPALAVLPDRRRRPFQTGTRES